MVTTRGQLDTSSVDPNQGRKPRKVQKTQNTATSPMMLDSSAKGSMVAIANHSAAQSSRETPGLPEPQSDGHEHANPFEPGDANGILDTDVDADGETINAETHVAEDPVANVSGQITTDSWSAINVAKVISLSSPEPSLSSSPGDISHSSEKQGLALGKSQHLSKAQRPAKLRKTNSTKDGSSGRYRVSKKSKSFQPKRPATNHVTTSNVCDGKWLSFPTTSNHRLIIFI
jgi:hypothetical protein